MKDCMVVGFFLLTTCTYSIAQVAQPSGKIDVNTAPGGIVTEFGPELFKSQGSYYLNEDWQAGSLKLKSGQIMDSVLLKYDLQSNRFEINMDPEIKVLDISKVYSVNMVTSSEGPQTQYVNCGNYLLDETPLLGLYEVVVTPNDSSIGLFSKIDLGLKKSYYVPALDVGERADRYTKTEVLFLVRGVVVVKLPKGRSTFWDFFGEGADELEAWTRDNNLKWKHKEDLAKIVKHHNALS